MTNIIFSDQLPNGDEALREFTDIYLNGILAKNDPPTPGQPANTIQDIPQGAP
jgi:hypothetical protein